MLDNYIQPQNLLGIVYRGHAGKAAGQGPFIQIYLGIEQNIIVNATYKTYGCPACISCF